MIYENSTETCTVPHVKQMTSASLMHKAGHSKLCSETIQRDKVGRKVGGGLKMGGHMCTHG